MSVPTRRHVLGAALGALAAPAVLRAGPPASPSVGRPGPPPPAPGPVVPPLGPRPDHHGEELPGRTPHTRFAVNVEMWFRELPFLQRIAHAADLGFPGVEFWPWRGKDLAAIGEVAGERGVEVAQFTCWGFSPHLNDKANLPAFLEEVEASCEAAHVVGAKKMTVVAGDVTESLSHDEMLHNVTAALIEAAPIAESHDVMLILEPMNGRVDHPGHCLYGSPDAVAICRAVDSPMVKINWDLYHMQISEGDLCGRLREGFDQLGYIQLADHPGRHEPGTGEIHYNRVLKEAYDLGYRGLVGLECSPSVAGDEAAWAVWRADQW